MATQDVTVRLRDPHHPNGQRIVSGVKLTRKWQVVNATDAVQAAFAADPAVEIDTTDFEIAAAAAASYAAVDVTLGNITSDVDISQDDADTIISRVAAAARTTP